MQLAPEDLLVILIDRAGTGDGVVAVGGLIDPRLTVFPIDGGADALPPIHRLEVLVTSNPPDADHPIDRVKPRRISMATKGPGGEGWVAAVLLSHSLHFDSTVTYFEAAEIQRELERSDSIWSGLVSAGLVADGVADLNSALSQVRAVEAAQSARDLRDLGIRTAEEIVKGCCSCSPKCLMDGDFMAGQG